jgi:hypothetical protein
MRGITAVIAVGAMLVLTACNSGMVAGLRTLQDEVMPTRLDVRQITLQPSFRYLLVEHKNQQALMVWVGHEKGPLGETTIWVSADGVILRLVQGRLVGVDEPARSWRLTSETVDTSSTVEQTPISQTSDEQPGFRLGVFRTVEKIELPSKPESMSWVEGNPDWQWVAEVDSTSGQSLAFYGMNAHRETMVGQRCLTPEWCLRWQAWPAKPSTSPS